MVESPEANFSPSWSPSPSSSSSSSSSSSQSSSPASSTSPAPSLTAKSPTQAELFSPSHPPTTPGKHLDIHEMPTVMAKTDRWRKEGTRFICTAGCKGTSMGTRYQATQHYKKVHMKLIISYLCPMATCIHPFANIPDLRRHMKHRHQYTKEEAGKLRFEEVRTSNTNYISPRPQGTPIHLFGLDEEQHLDHQSTEHCIHQPAEHPHQHLIHQPAEHRHQHLIHQPAEYPHQHFIHQPVEHPHQHLNHPPAEHPHQRVNQTTNPTPTAAAHQLAEQLHHKTTRDKPTTLKERRLG